jgi:hypothetical protein
MRYNESMEKSTKRKKWDDKYRINNLEKCREATRRSYRKHIKKQRRRSLLKNRKSRKEHPEKWKEWDKKYEHTHGRIFVVYKKSAKSRGIKFEVTKEEFLKFIEKPCRYCGEKAMGVDRIDNKKGYLVGNIGSCCGWCNRMKNDKNEKDFLLKCKMIVDNMGRSQLD